jgi:hypothetical protein
LRHASRAGQVFLLLPRIVQLELALTIGVTPSIAALMTVSAIRDSFAETDQSSVVQAVFPFVLGPTHVLS